MVTFGTVCDGIGCGHLAFVRAGFACAWSAEIEPFPCAVLAERFPGVRNIGDMRLAAEMVAAGEIGAPDVFIGGTPCQAFSVAGKREGLKDERGNLSLEFCRIADAIDAVRRGDGKPPCVVLWENVPGVLSDKGNAFGCFLGELAGSGCELQPPGYGWRDAGCVFGPGRAVAWRTLDSQYFGVAQRRKRVFVVASAGDGCRTEEVLFEREGVRRDSPPSREAREAVAPTLDVRAGRSGETSFHTSGGLVVEIGPAGGKFTDLSVTLDARSKDGHIRNQVGMAVMAHGQGGCATYDMRGNGDGVTVGTLTGDHAVRPTDYTPVVVASVCGAMTHALRGEGYDASEDGTVRGTPVVAFQQNQLGEVRVGECCGTLNTNSNASGRNTPMVATPMQVRRLTPRECERLQGLPDDWTRIPWRGKPAEACPDGPRYKGVGNGQTVQVMEWLARRVMGRLKAEG